MSMIAKHRRCRGLLAIATIVACAAGCGTNGKQPILGTSAGAALAPTVTAAAPANGATGVRIANTLITATFDEPVAALSGGRVSR